MTKQLAQPSKTNTFDAQAKEDRNFDAIADHFEKKVYGGLKGAIRLAVLRRDLSQQIARLTEQLNRPLRILDVGAGLAQLSIEFALAGHDVTINDISRNMLDKAKATANSEIAERDFLMGSITGDQEDTTASESVENRVEDIGNIEPKLNSTNKPEVMGARAALANITWLECPYQQLDELLSGKYDLILCHALLEWLAEPQAIMDFFDGWLADHGVLSLCFYNPVSFDYRNLIMGNFNLLNNKDFKSDNKKSLTPNNPVPKEAVTKWLQTHDYQLIGVSGLRVFHDYAPLKRGGHAYPDAVIEMELRYSDQEPYKWLGRYLHYLATPA